jgi:hypothetical protein
MAACENAFYVDDSGSSPREAIFVLAGLLSTVEEWAKFSNKWVLALSQPPKLDYFKMSEAASLQPSGQFARSRGWNEALRDDRLVTLARIVRDHVKVRASVSIRHEHFNKYLRTIPAVGRRLATDHPYPVLFAQLVTAELTQSFRLGLVEPHDYILDEQTGFDSEIEDLWPQYKRDMARSARPELAGLLGSKPYFRDDKQFLPLQAADLYAWQVRNHAMLSRVLHIPLNRVLRVFQGVPSFHYDMNEARCIRDRDKLRAREGDARKENPALMLVSFPETPREQKKARRAHRRARGLPPSPRRPRS